jgi:hypothetical protein
VDELCFMNFLPVEIFQAAVQTLFPSFLLVKAVVASPDDPATQTKQTHVLRTNPKRVPMPTEGPATATTVFVQKQQRDNHIGPWLDRNDHMASDPIEVRRLRTLSPPYKSCKSRG